MGWAIGLAFLECSSPGNVQLRPLDLTWLLPELPRSDAAPVCPTLGLRLSEECCWVPASVLTHCTCIPCSRCSLECRLRSAQCTLAGRDSRAHPLEHHPRAPATERNPRANSASSVRGVANSEALLTSPVLCGLRGLRTLAWGHGGTSQAVLSPFSFLLF